MSTVPPASKVAADAAAVRGLALQVAETYRAVHDSGYDRDSAADRAGRGGRIAEDGSENGTTASVGVGREAVRAKLATAAEGVELASTLLGGVLVTLRQVVALVEREAGHAPDELNQLIPRDVTKAEVAEARARQARRDAEEALHALRRARGAAGRERAKTKPKKGGRVK
jgi:hypothetical protein